MTLSFDSAIFSPKSEGGFRNLDLWSAAGAPTPVDSVEGYPTYSFDGVDDNIWTPALLSPPPVSAGGTKATVFLDLEIPENPPSGRTLWRTPNKSDLSTFLSAGIIIWFSTISSAVRLLVQVYGNEASGSQNVSSQINLSQLPIGAGRFKMVCTFNALGGGNMDIDCFINGTEVIYYAQNSKANNGFQNNQWTPQCSSEARISAIPLSTWVAVKHTPVRYVVWDNEVLTPAQVDEYLAANPLVPASSDNRYDQLMALW